MKKIYVKGAIINNVLYLDYIKTPVEFTGKEETVLAREDLTVECDIDIFGEFKSALLFWEYKGSYQSLRSGKFVDYCIQPLYRIELQNKRYVHNSYVDIYIFDRSFNESIKEIRVDEIIVEREIDKKFRPCN
jgi:hypothetical protein